jgi:hypothetical protein
VIKKVLVLIVALPVLTGVVSVFAQDSLSNQPKNKLGFATGIGVQYLSQLFGADRAGPNVASNYYYHVRFYELQYYRTISKNKLYELDLLVQPQYNIARYGLYPESTDYFDAYEFGLNLGVLYRKHIANTPLNWYASLSTGPHYASGVPHRQTSGFLFSNNLFIGINLKLCKNLYADTRLGIRHMSNAGTRLPNAGVNNVVVKQGVLIEF